MAQRDVMSSFWRGVRHGTPFILVVGPFALLFGVIAAEAGLHVTEALAFSVVVIAGAAQFTALQLMGENAPTWVVLLSALAVNLRMVMYSASLTPHLGSVALWKRGLVAYFLVDQAYAVSILEYERDPNASPAVKFAYFIGVVLPIVPFWYGLTALGALVGASIPPELGLDFALPIAFIAMIAPALRTGAHRAAATVSVVLVLCLTWMPFNLGLIMAALGGMATGAEIERRYGL
jgi:4-azaleucine resistance transporter AzlC